MLRIESVHKKIDDKQVLSGVSLHIQPGTIIGLIGRNGTGKTTLMRTIVGIYDPEQGQVMIDDINVHKLAQSKRDIVFIPDSPIALEGYTLQQCAQLFGSIYPNFDGFFFHEAMERFHLPVNKPVRSLSKGMKMLFSTALGLATRARVIMLDEPTNGVDAVAKKHLLALIMESVTPDSAILISSHMLHELDRIADTVVLLRDGRTDEQWALEDLRSQVRKLQIVFTEHEPPAWLQQEQVYVLQQVGRVFTVLIESEELYGTLRQQDTLLIEELPLTLEDWFSWKSGGDGDVA
ncbi:ABC transporter ATP-binding protein [Paenibacillus sp. ACRRX]|uniref:ABC transporter ATP-binding protein n=1 Tax=unclassified Paenibacillus TaxID=185978 RepID=UPI001EF70899|nr:MULTISPECIES: ABC transporter ATP-binding protein [unclassified Paenibacillus]MCG7408545.1 ABC transporter ATP-binding protein [Paenibacillus sp. ACRRX]MDK8182793.1 ABC transporter ATP-binding protein [Paenibacillus sp. UMB4589-SE434]